MTPEDRNLVDEIKNRIETGKGKLDAIGKTPYSIIRLITRLVEELAAKDAEIARLREALKHFADLYLSTKDAYVPVHVQHIRRARAALEQKS